jgi:3-oxoacyl-[acyl-carrier-protein] synthase II
MKYARRVVVTGMGCVNPLGLTVSETWKNILDGKSGIGLITRFDTSEFNVQVAGEIQNFDSQVYMTAKEARRMDLFEQYGIAAAQQAIDQANIDMGKEDATRFGVIISSAVGGLTSMYDGILVLDKEGPRRVGPFVIPMFMSNGASGLVAIWLGAQGPCLSVASACASSGDGIGQAATMIRAGYIDACLAGGSDAAICAMGISCFDRMGALSRNQDPPNGTPRPFDAARDGFVMAEGAAVLVLESLEHARARGADILGELVGYGSTADAFHITAPDENGVGGSKAIRRALEDANLKPEEVDYINAHGTGTVLNDIAETRAIKAALGEHAKQVAVSSTKSMTGHMMGATGALEAIFCLLAIQDNLIPPTINLSQPDPECDLDYVPGSPRKAEVNVTLSNAFGFGGHNAVLAFRAFSG